MTRHRNIMHQKFAAVMRRASASAVILATVAILSGGGSAQVASSARVPAPRAHHSLVYDFENKRVLLVGGSTPVDLNGTRAYTFFDDLWSFDGSGWQALGASGAMRSGQAVAYDTKRNRVLAFGGYCDCRQADHGRYSDLLELRRGRWHSIATANRAVTEAGMAYDSRRDRMVLFGGSDGGRQLVGETWEYDGSAWITVTIDGPSARVSPSLAYDAKRGRTVLFGGVGSVPLGDTWEYDGTAWTRVAVKGPPAIPRAGMTFDSKRGLVILFANGTWAWDGVLWKQLSDAGPGARQSAMLAYDRERDRVVMFGGREGPPFRDLNETWEWDGARWHHAK